MSRLIDADKLITDMNTRAEEEYLEFRDIRNMVEYAPTIHAIPLDKVKKAREEIEKNAYSESVYGDFYAGTQVVSMDLVFEILDKLIKESENT